MSEKFNIYCDESCHLENDNQKAMVLGAVWCPTDKRREIAVRIREIKQKHGLKADFEIKWTKVSLAKLQFYMDIIDYFFDDDHLHFRGLVIPDKSVLHHDDFGQTHDEWYYKMYFNMLKVIFDPYSDYRIYIDIKDSRGGSKVNKLHDVLCNNLYDFSKKIVEYVQIVESRHVEQLQIADLLIGCLSYLHRGLSGNSAKEALIKRVKARSSYSLMLNTLYQEKKFNLFVWRGQGPHD
ncbi:MAG: DUF3800 domain-containing protein [bacterium]|nr:DUF3800 domain-containing protein [bacterium]